MLSMFFVKKGAGKCYAMCMYSIVCTNWNLDFCNQSYILLVIDLPVISLTNSEVITMHTDV